MSQGNDEMFLKSTEIFHPKTRTWINGPDLPFELAYATVVTTPKESWIVGGKTLKDIPASVFFYIFH